MSEDEVADVLLAGIVVEPRSVASLCWLENGVGDGAWVVSLGALT